MHDFIDGVEQNRKHPKTFHIPTEEEKAGLEVGDYVKVGHNDERFWVQLTRITDDGLYTGVIDNELVCEQPFGYGDPIQFERRHILSTYED